MSFKFDYSCNSLSYKVDMFPSCEQVKGNVLMRQKQRIFQLVEQNLKTKVSDTSWFAKRDLQLATINHYNVFWLEKLTEPTAVTPYVKWPDSHSYKLF